jgi:uncharacterized membrane protein
MERAGQQMTYSPLLIVHICCGLVGLLSGSAALAARKGGRVHRRAGDTFVVSMMCMAASGAYLGFAKSDLSNVIAGGFTFYLVATAFLTVKRNEGETGRAEFGLLLVGVAVGATAMIFGWLAAHRPAGSKGDPAALYFTFGSVILLAAAGDVRVLARGGVSGIPRLVRHLWRMCVGLFIAAGSFFLGTASKTGLRARLFTQEIRKTHLPEVPVLLVVALMISWLFRVRYSKAYRMPTSSRAERPIAKEVQMAAETP